MKRSAAITAIAALAALAASGCAGAQTPAETVAEPGGLSAGPAPEPETVEAQVERGDALFADRCAGCHGGAAGPTAPPVIGRGALPVEPRDEAMVRERRFETGADVLAFVSEHMPRNAPGSMAQEDYESVVAYLLAKNGHVLSAPLDPETAASVSLQ